MLSTIRFPISVFARHLAPEILSAARSNRADLTSNEIWSDACRARIETWREVLRRSYDEHVQACSDAVHFNSAYLLEPRQAHHLAESMIGLVDLGGFSTDTCLELSNYVTVDDLEVTIGPLVNFTVESVERNLITPLMQLWAASYQEPLPGTGVGIEHRRISVGELASWAMRELEAVEDLLEPESTSPDHPYR
jgi:hypothetical protein